MRWAAASAPREVRSKPHSEEFSPNKTVMAAISGLYPMRMSSSTVDFHPELRRLGG